MRQLYSSSFGTGGRAATLCLCALLCAPAPAQTPHQPISAAQIDTLVRRAMTTFDAPGIAVGIVKDGQLVFARGYGIRRLGERDQVDTDTLFAIGSNTKAFTAAALGILVDEHKIGWDDRVIDHIPEFRMYDPYVTREFTIRDLLTHRSGLGDSAGDLMFVPSSDFTRQDLIRALRYLKPEYGFRYQYAYDNPLYVVAGEIVPAATGTSWEDFVQTRILHKLNMEPCTVSRRRLTDHHDVASSHARVDGVMAPIAEEDLQLVAPAGGIECNLTGMARWVEALLAEGKTASGETLFSAAQSHEMWSPQTIVPVEKGSVEEMLGMHLQAYALGWVVSDLRGYKFVQHDGDTSGMSSMVALLPELHLGVIVLVNEPESPTKTSIALQIVDAYVHAPKRDWVAVYKAASEGGAQAARVAQAQVENAVARAAPPTLPLAKYVGTYRDAWRGDATVRLDGAKLVLKFSHTNDLEGVLQPSGGNNFVVRWNDRSLDADAYVRFSQGYVDDIEGMTLQLISPLSDSSFDFKDLDFKKTQ